MFKTLCVAGALTLCGLTLGGCIPLLVGGLVGYEISKDQTADLICQPAKNGAQVCRKQEH